MRRKRIFRIGIAVIVLMVLQHPILLFIVGKVEEGIVINEVYDSAFPSNVTGTSYYSQVEFTYNGKIYTILGEENERIPVGTSVKVIFFSWKPEKASVRTFGGLFTNAFIELPLGLLIWWALFKSYPDLFSDSISKKQYARLLLKGKLRRYDPGISGFSRPIRFTIYLIVFAISAMLIYVTALIVNETISGNISYQLGIGTALALMAMSFLILQKILRG